MDWEKLLKLALEQSAAILLGFLAVYLVQPETPEGAVLLIVIVVAIYNVVRQVFAWARRRLAEHRS